MTRYEIRRQADNKKRALRHARAFRLKNELTEKQYRSYQFFLGALPIEDSTSEATALRLARG